MPSYDQLRLRRRKFSSDIVTVGTDITLNIDENSPHIFAAVEFFSDAQGTFAAPTGGTITFTAETAELPNVFQELTNGTVDASNNRSVNVSSNVTNLKAVTSSIAGATHCRLNVTSNLS